MSWTLVGTIAPLGSSRELSRSLPSAARQVIQARLQAFDLGGFQDANSLATRVMDVSGEGFRKIALEWRMDVPGGDPTAQQFRDAVELLFADDRIRGSVSLVQSESKEPWFEGVATDTNWIWRVHPRPADPVQVTRVARTVKAATPGGKS